MKKNKPETEFLFVGTKSGPEKQAVEGYKIPFKAISSGKLRRYFSWSNFIDPLKVIWGFFQSLSLILKFKPNAVLIAGSFVGVPAAWSAWLLRKPILVHQQDVIAGLANKLMANLAERITVSFDFSLKDFAKNKTVLTGNPVREEYYVCDPIKSKTFFNLKEGLPLVLICGGGTGSVKVNEVVEQSLAELLQFCQVIHLTGKGKKMDIKADNYHQFEFLTNEMTEALCASDLVVNRAGMSTLSELSILAKPSIIIPIGNSHQEFNARYFQKNNAILNLSEKTLNNEIFTNAVKEILFDDALRENLSRNISKMMGRDGAEKAAKIVLEIAR
ncbi:MAG: UDP-N-acetylglucosamine--N-acetylmuramyl-(pentapeptide) pyrophosphoryl-undecaprenol N-acetylglucosamine transferase [Patescibacteria group bacterium]